MWKKYVLILSIQITSLSLFSQNLDWAQSAGGSGGDIGMSVTVDLSKNVISTGWFSGSSNFGVGSSSMSVTSSGYHDVYIVKQNSSGRVLWLKNVGGSSLDRGLSIVTGHSNNIYVTGHFKGTADFDPGSSSHFLTSSGQDDVFILKLDQNGNFVWAKSFGGQGSDIGLSIKVDRFDNVYTTGWFHGTVDFDPSSATHQLAAPASNIPDAFISKLDSSGNFIWAKHFTGYGQNLGYDLVIDSMQNVYASGSFSSTADFDPSSSSQTLSASNIDAYLVKLDSLGNHIWSKKISGTNNDKGLALRMDEFGNLYTSGYFTGNATFDTVSISNNGNEDIFVAKYKTNGSLVWAKGIGGSGSDESRSLAVDNEGSVYVGGLFSNTVDFDPSSAQSLRSSNGGNDWFLLKLDSTGNYQWDMVGGGSGGDGLFNVTVTQNRTLYFIGKFQNTMDMDPSSSTFPLSSASANTNDIFIAKYTQCSQTSSQRNVYACDSYTSPSGNYTWTVGGIYHDTIQNVGGCDSVITINLQVKQSSSNVIFHSTCDRYTSPSGKYTWLSSGTYTDTITNSNGCDSTLIIGLIIKNSSADTIYENLCRQSSYVSPSANYVWTSTGVYQDTIANHEGCDSVITVDLTLNNPDTSIYVTNNTTLTSNESGAQYQWVDCNNNFSPLQGETQQSFTATSNGSYAVVVSKNNCLDTSNCYQVVLTGISKFSDDKAEYSFFPNPTKGILNVDFKNRTDLYIYDTSAKLVYHQNSIVGRKRVDLSVLSDGVYFVKGVTANGVFSEKLILAK